MIQRNALRRLSLCCCLLAGCGVPLACAQSPSVVLIQPASQPAFAGETATFAVHAAGTPASHYQWRKNGAAIPGATAVRYSTPPLAPADNNSIFDVLVSGAGGNVASAPLTLRVGPFATVYTTQKGAKLDLYAWPGTKNALLTKTASLDAQRIRAILKAADDTWDYYARATGQLPAVDISYNGLATIANTTSLCGAGCTEVGATGMELSDKAFAWLYDGVARQEYDQVMFYEFGRSFWLAGKQLEYKDPDSVSCMVTGFAVLMRYRSIQAEGLKGSFDGSAQKYLDLYNRTLPLLDHYVADPALNWQNTFRSNTYSDSGLGCSDLFTSLVLRLAQHYGGEAFIQALYKEAAKLPAANTTQQAVDNFVLAASAASHRNLGPTFRDTWRWPVSTQAMHRLARQRSVLDPLK